MESRIKGQSESIPSLCRDNISYCPKRILSYCLGREKKKRNKQKKLLRNDNGGKGILC